MNRDDGDDEMDEGMLAVKINPSDSDPANPIDSHRMKGTMAKFTGQADLGELPMTRRLLPWYKFNVDFWSNQRGM